MSTRPRRASPVELAPATKIATASEIYRKEVQYLSVTLLDTQDRAKRADLLVSLQATAWFQGRCDAMVALIREGDVGQAAIERFAGRLPSTSEMKKSSQAFKRDLMAIRSPMAGKSPEAMGPEETTEVVSFSSSFRWKFLLFIAGALFLIAVLKGLGL